ncbi:cation diffusion facilitator transporter [Mycolicibacterium madagascariense]|uniref:Cation diffusion facilitator transporter n=1 Tax=Mycolicibacterium madagascariense TaxID=212765 RepID=A0A7I7XMT0_9MYCO|nr:cation diffusion facilitator family transporter [Mycolicibacterium madagascariense]MCV7013058.1 cation diffusion facilitator family transporter [Mycolicibacterium madagascariense]BBZ30362.1 cation diffusion facilitator transporter [Mycolicibacterium madagascariense]
MVKAGGDSTVTVVVAFAANLAVALAKTVASVLSGSASMTAEAAHSWADTGNEIFLLIANRRSTRDADERRPLGYGREAYVWSLLAAVGLFVVGAAVSIWRGVSELLHGADSAEDYRIAYIVLAVSFVLEGTSLLQSLRQLRRDAEHLKSDVLRYAFETSDPTVRAVFAEDSAALIGILIAFAGILLHQLTGDVVWDALGSILVGLVLGGVALVLINRNRIFLTGEAGPERLQQALRERLASFPEVASVRFLRPEFIGPKQIFVIASVDLIGDAVESSVARTLRMLEHRFEDDVPEIREAVLTVSEPDDAGIAVLVTTDPKTSESDSGPAGAPDVQSDPAKGAEDRSDWSDEGGATPTGPAEDA